MRRGYLHELVDQVNTKAHGRKPISSRYVGLEHIEPGARGLTSTAPSSVSESTNGVFEKGDVLFGKLRPNLRKAVQVDFGGYCSTDLLVLRPRTGVDTRYAGHVVSSEFVFRHAERNSIGTGMPRTSWHAVSQASIWAPPLEEQRRIAEILDSIDETIQATERVIAKLELVRNGLLESSIPVGDLVKLKELASVSVGFVGPTQMHYTTPDRGVPFLRTGNIGTGQIRSVNMRYISHAFNVANQKSVLQEGDVVVSRVGYTGNAAVIEQHFAGANCANMIIVRSGPRLESRFLSILFESRLIGQQVQAMTAGSAQPVFNIKLVERLRVPNVGSVEQLDTVSAIHDIDQLLAAERDSIRKLIATRAGLAADLLSGRVRTVAA